MFIESSYGTTPLDPDEMDGLIPTHIATQEDLNEWEQANIVDAQLWVKDMRLVSTKILNQRFVKKLHKKMFNKTWHWAGEFRNTDKNIGINWYNVPVQLEHLFDDVEFWLLNKTYNISEVAVRFHHRLVFIHPFVNGNGRWSRLATDLFLLSQKKEKFSWGGVSLKEEDLRKFYIQALKKADKHDYSLLLEFVKL